MPGRAKSRSLYLTTPEGKTGFDLDEVFRERITQWADDQGITMAETADRLEWPRSSFQRWMVEKERSTTLHRISMAIAAAGWGKSFWKGLTEDRPADPVAGSARAERACEVLRSILSPGELELLARDITTFKRSGTYEEVAKIRDAITGLLLAQAKRKRSSH